MKQKLIYLFTPYVCCFSLLFLLQQKVLSQHYEFKNISGKNGLVGSGVFSSVEDEKGYMWFVTNKAICRFDGTNFKVFGYDEGYTEIGGYHLYKDKRNRIWVISFNFNLFYFDGTNFRQFKGIENPCWIAEDQSGCVWIGTRESLYYKVYHDMIVDSIVNTGPHQSILYNFTIKNRDSIISTHIDNIKEIIHGKVHILPIQSNRKYYIAPRLFLLKNGNVLIASEEGIYSKNPSENKVTLVYPIHQNEVICFFEDTLSNDIWIGTRSGGAIRFKKGIIHPSNTEKYFTNISIHSIIKNREGLYWFCTDMGGIYYGNFIAQHVNTMDGIPSNDIRFVQNSNDDIYFVTRNGKFNLLFNHKIVKLKQNISAEEFIRLIHVYKTTNQNIYFTSIGSNILYKLWERTFTRMNYPDVRLYVPFKNQSSLYYISSALFKESPHKSIYAYDTVNSLLGYPSISALPQLNIGDSAFYYVLDNLCLKIIIRKNQRFFEKIHLPYALSQMDITQKGTIILQTKQKGIILMKNNTYEYVNTSNGLINDYCNKIYYNDHKIWVCTDNGLSKVILDTNDHLVRVENYTSANFLIADEVRDILAYKGKIYVATAGGLSFFDEKEIKKNTFIQPQVYIRTISINSKDTSTYIDHYILPYNENNISVSYATISFNGSAGNLFKYKLDGVDQEFNYTTNTTIRFANLNPGGYRFVVYVRNNFGNWSPPTVTYFTILKPYWKTWWFISLYVFASVAAIAYFVLQKIKRVRKENKFKHQLVQSELRALRLYMNPHFIFNSLNSLQMFILKNNVEEAGSYILSFSRVIRMIMKYSSRSSITIEEEKELLTKYIHLEQRRFTEAFEFSITIDPEIDTLNTHIPTLIIQPFVENAIKHGLSGMSNNGKLLIEFIRQDSFICCVITDNGIGREKAKKKQLSMNNNEDSTGIRYIEDRLKLLAQDKNIRPVEIVDLYEDEIALGTRVKLLIPIL
ncbi:MAG: histidine kinase [Bacteroidota bacterium]